MLPKISKPGIISLFDRSSVRSEDEVSEANTAGTQVRHRSRMQPALDDSPPEDDRSFSQTSVATLPSRLSETSEDDTSEDRKVKYRSMDADEAERSHQEYMQEIAAGNDAWNHVSRHLGIPSYHDNGVLADFNDEDIGPRPSTPPRRRPRIPSINNYCLRSFGSASDSSDSMDQFLVPIYRGSGTTESKSDRDNQRHTAQTFDSIPEDSEPVSLKTSEEYDAISVRRQDNRTNALHALTSLSSTDTGSGRNSDSSQEDPDVTRLKSTCNKVRRQGKVDWRGDLTNGATQASPGLVSATGEVYGLGNHDAGYNSGDFVTDVQSKKILQPEPKKNRSRRFFRF